MLKVVVTFAVRAEFAPWRRFRNFHQVKDSAVPTYVARFGETEVHAVITGIGARNLMPIRGDICIVSGLAGSLSERHIVGTTLVARAVQRENADTVLQSDERLMNVAAQCGATAVDFFCTVDAVVNTASEKLRLSRIADAVDMETFHIMSEAALLGVPAVAVRTISDTVEQPIPLDFNRAIDGEGEIAWLPALSQVATAPARIPRLVRFGFDSSRAARKLAHFLDAYVERLR